MNEHVTSLVVCFLFFYVVSPHDIISECHYGVVGTVDDIFVVALLGSLVSRKVDSLATVWMLFVTAWCTLASWITYVCPLYEMCRHLVNEDQFSSTLQNDVQTKICY